MLRQLNQRVLEGIKRIQEKQQQLVQLQTELQRETDEVQKLLVEQQKLQENLTQAILTNEGEGQAKFFGWSEPFEDCAAIKAKHDEAEDMTDRLCASGLSSALANSQYELFGEGIRTLRAATP